LSEPRERREDLERIKTILNSLTEFIKNLEAPMKGIVTTIIEAMNGKRLGEEVAAFYKALVDNGVPPEDAKEMTREFFRRRLEATNIPYIIERLIFGSRERGEESKGQSLAL
jgi:hypothetical protein